MTSRTSDVLSPVLYLPHGGGPLPLLGDEEHGSLVSFLRRVPEKLGEPSAIVVVSAHWEEDQATVTSGRHPELIYDYYGFPPESYQIQYRAPGHPQLAKELVARIKASGLRATLDEHRGFDHGLFVPLKLMYPNAEIPCIQLSLLKSMDPEEHIELGKSIAILRKHNVLIVGSGMSFHNLPAFFSPDRVGRNENDEFDRWLVETCTSASISSKQREQRLAQWEEAPSARFCHPREEHLLPLHVCYGVAGAETPTAQVVFNQDVMGKRVSSLLWTRENVME